MIAHLLPHSLIQGVDLLGIILLVGGIAFRMLVNSTPPARPSQIERGLPFALIAIGLVDLALRSQMITGRHGIDAVALLPTVLLKTHFGNVWIARTVFLLLLAIPSVACSRAAPAACALLLLSASLSGHAADSGNFSLAVLTDWLHLLAVSIWIGGLVYLASFLRRRTMSVELSPSPTTSTEVRRFSTLAGLSVAVVAATGAFQFWHRVGGVKALLQTNYGQTLAVKLILVFGLLALGALNRYVLVPKFSHRPEPRKLFNSVSCEIALALAILACVAILLQLPPARNQVDNVYQVASHPGVHQARQESRRSSPLPAEGAEIKILRPEDGETFIGDQVPVRFRLTKGKHGHHVHAYVDGELMGMFESQEGTLTGIRPGRHALELRVVAEDHQTELDAGDRIEFVVK